MRKRLVNQQCLSRRLLQLSLLCAMMLAPLGAWAQTFSGGGNGSEDNPYIISSFDDLMTLSTYVNNGTFTTEHFKLDDGLMYIDCENKHGFVPIGNLDHPFKGTFDGVSIGIFIGDLVCSMSEATGYNGLFGVIDGGTVKNLKLARCSFTGGNEVGAIVGFLKSGTIEGCSVATCTVTSGNAQNVSVGGVAGTVYDGTISGCSVFATGITGSTTYSEEVGFAYAGGIVGYIYSANNSNIAISSNSVDQGTTATTVLSSHTNPNAIAAGGIVGQCDGGNILISGNTVKDNTSISSVDGSNYNSDYFCSGAIVGNISEGYPTYSENYYYYTVTTSTKKGSAEAQVKNSNEQRGAGYIADEANYSYDIVLNNGIVLYNTKRLDVHDIDGFDTEISSYYYPLSDRDKGYIALAPGSTTTMTMSSDSYTSISATLVYTPKGETDQTTVNLNNSSTNGGYVFSFEMPDAEDAAFHVTSSPIASIWIGDAQVDENGHFQDYSENVASFKTENGVNTLTLNDLSYDGAITSGLDNLTVKVFGTTNSVKQIVSTNPNAILTVTKGTEDASISLSTTNSVFVMPVVSGFASVACAEGMYINSNYPYSFDTTEKTFVKRGLSTGVVQSMTFTSTPYYKLWKKEPGGLYTQINAEHVGSQGNISFTPGTVNNGNTNILTLNNATMDAGFDSGLGDLTIDIQGENSLTLSDTASVVRSLNGGKLKITKSVSEASLTLHNSYSTNHSPVIKDFDAFELADGLYLSDTKSGYYGEGDPAIYDEFVNCTENGGNETKGLVDATYIDNSSKGISNVTISNIVKYPIWIASYKDAQRYNTPVYAQVTPDNKEDVLDGTDNDGKVIFIPASANNGNVNTLRLNSAVIIDAIVTNLPNLTIEFAGTNTLDYDGMTDGFICSGNPNAVLTFKAIAADGSITMKTANGRCVVEGFADVKFENCTGGNATYNKTARRFNGINGWMSLLTVSADLSPYGLTIGDVAVNSFNADNIPCEGGTVSYDPDKYELTLNGATIGTPSEAKNITFNGKALNVKLMGINYLYGSFTRTETNSKGGLSFNTNTDVATLAMSTDIPTDKFDVSYQNKLKKEGFTISLPSDYGITIAGTLITPSNRENVTGAGISGKVSFDSNGQLVLEGATIDGAIEVTDPSKLPAGGLRVHLTGNNTITNTSGKAISLTGANGNLTFATIGEAPGKLVYNNSGATTTASAFQNFAVACVNNLDSKAEGSSVTVAPALDLYVSGTVTEAQTTYGTDVTTSSNTNGTTIDGLHYTMGDGQNSVDEGGPDLVNGKQKLVFTENTVMTQDKVDESANMTPATSDFDAIFKGVTGMLPPGVNLIELLGVEIADNYDLFVKIGKQDPVAIKQLIETIGEEKVAKIKATLSESAMFQIYLKQISTSPAPAMKVDHRIGPKSSVAGALGGVKVSNSSVQSSAGPAATYKAMEKATMAAAIADMGDPHNGYSCNDPDITDLADNMFIDNSSNPSPALRRAGDLIPGTILPDGLPFIDFSGTKITGMEVSRTSGPFNGVPENVFIYMPAGNTTKDNNVVIGDICDKVELNGSTDAKPFKAMKNFKAGQATLKRTFEAGGTDSKATIYLPYNIEQEDADKLGKFYKYEGNNGTTVSMNQVTSGGLKANMPYIFEAKEGGVTDPLVRVVNVVANPAETEGFKGVYERKEYEAGMYCYAAEATSENTKGQFVEMGPGSYVPPFRAYMIGSGVPSYAIAWDGVIDNMDDDENTTAVETVKTSSNVKTREGWWTLNGMRMTEKPKKAGLYILNGRMVVVK